MLGCFGGFVIPQQVFWSWIQECLRYAVARSFSKFRKVSVQSFFFPEETENVSWKKDISDSYRLNIQSRPHPPFPPYPPPPPFLHGGHAGGQEQMRYPLLGTKLFFIQILRKKIIVLSTSMVAVVPNIQIKLHYVLPHFADLQLRGCPRLLVQWKKTDWSPPPIYFVVVIFNTTFSSFSVVYNKE